MGCYKERMLREEDVGKIVERASASVGAPLLSSVAEEGKASMIVGLLIGSLLVANSAPSLAGLFVFGVGWLNSGLAQSALRSYPNNDLAGRSISGGSTRRVALTERTRSASTFLGLPLTRNSGKSSQRT